MIQLLKELFEKYNIEYNEIMLKKLYLFYSEVIKVNEVMNLTNITDEKDFAVKNILDSVLPINMIPKNALVVDVGAGAGFPSIPLKILRPDLKIVMIDSLNKRIKFLNDVVAKLEIDDIKAIHSRAEDFALNNREKFDVAVSRAVSRLNTLCEYCLPLVKVGGMFIAYKSIKAEEEIEEAQKGIQILGGKVASLQNILVKEIESVRINIIIKKENPTPKQYPRGKNLPKLKPLM